MLPRAQATFDVGLPAFEGVKVAVFLGFGYASDEGVPAAVAFFDAGFESSGWLSFDSCQLDAPAARAGEQHTASLHFMPWSGAPAACVLFGTAHGACLCSTCCLMRQVASERLHLLLSSCQTLGA